MSESNIFNSFKESLGLYCSACQFIELSTKCLNDKFGDILKQPEQFQQLCKNHKISISTNDLPKALPYVPLSYIVYVNSCFEDFLKELEQEIKHFGKESYSKRKDNESHLKCLCRNICVNALPKEIDSAYQVCDYYRQIRNAIAHMLSEDASTPQFQKISGLPISLDTKIYGVLNAPNPLGKICFDDFILFSKSCLTMAKFLYETMRLDYEKLIKDADEKSKQKLKSSQHPRKSLLDKWKNFTPERRREAITQFIQHRYRCDEDFERKLDELVEKYSIKPHS